MSVAYWMGYFTGLVIFTSIPLILILASALAVKRLAVALVGHGIRISLPSLSLFRRRRVSEESPYMEAIPLGYGTATLNKGRVFRLPEGSASGRPCKPGEVGAFVLGRKHGPASLNGEFEEGRYRMRSETIRLDLGGNKTEEDLTGERDGGRYRLWSKKIRRYVFVFHPPTPPRSALFPRPALSAGGDLYLPEGKGEPAMSEAALSDASTSAIPAGGSVVKRGSFGMDSQGRYRLRVA